MEDIASRVAESSGDVSTDGDDSHVNCTQNKANFKFLKGGKLEYV